MAMMWALVLLLVLLLLLCLNPVESQDKNRLILKDGPNPCEGYIQVYHNKKWGYVGVETLSSEDKKVVCRSIECGEPVDSVDIMLPLNSLAWLRELKCNGSEENLWNCTFSRWNAGEYRGQTVERIRCSHTIQLSLEGFPCAGVVQYSTDGQTPLGYVCGDKWGEHEGNLVCKDLNCGNLREIPKWSYSSQNSKMITTNCLGTEKHLWDCAPKAQSCSKPAMVYCQDHEMLRFKGNNSNVCSGTLEMKQEKEWTAVTKEHNETTFGRWCRQMYCGSYVNHTTDKLGTQLTCSDEVRVVLRDNNQPSRCYGTVYLEVNSTHSPVCASSWANNPYNSEVVCRELGCGQVFKTVTQSLVTKTLMDWVNCTMDDQSLWHCNAKHSQQPFTCKEQVYLICSGSTQVMLKDGPGRCSGRLEIFYEGQWQKVHKTRWNEFNSKTVCKHLNCGDLENSNSEKFSKGPSSFFNKFIECKENSQSIFECSIQDNMNNQFSEEEIVSITCQDYKDVFLSADFCRGDVGVQASRQTYWLSGSADSWNKAVADTICRQMHCGTAQTFGVTHVNASDNHIWKSFNCPSNLTSVFDCYHNISLRHVNNTDAEIASVNCTGTKTMNLTNTCWGYVNICEEGQCGGLCEESWTNAKAEILCQELGCGDHIVPVDKKNRNFSPVEFKSVHLLKDGNDLRKSHIVKRNQSDHSCKGNAYVVCSGSLKPRFEQPKDYCSGNVHLHQEKRWLPLCNEVLKDNDTANVMCEQLDCGYAVQSTDYYGSIQNTEYVPRLDCPENSTSFKSCTPSANVPSCTPRGLQCSNWKQMVLVKGEDACSGIVFVYSNDGKRAAVSAEGWTNKESQRLCEDLGCGKEGTFYKEERIKDVTFWKGSFNCTAVERPQNIWKCEKKEPPTDNKQLYIKCSESPTVNLTQTCHGEVLIDGEEVCDTLWDPSYSDLVCQEMKCSFAIPGGFNRLRPQSQSKEYQHVSCEKYHNKLGQCRRFKGPCKGRLVTVHCSGNVKFKTTGECGGDIEVNFQDGKWERVCSEKDLPFKIKKNLCRELKCGDPFNKRNNNKQMDLNVSLTCTEDHQHIRYCLSKKTCAKKPVQIFCIGYVDPNKKQRGLSSVVVPTVLALGLILILAIGVFIFLRFYLRRKNRSIKDFLPRFSKKKEEEFESGEYEDMPSKEMHDLSSHGLHVFTPEAANEGSASSLAYDNVDEICETQPLTSKDPERTRDDEGDYEVDDPQDSYDDIDASPDTVQTVAEVHPRPSSEAPPDLVLGDDDYLVPGQDA